VFGIAFAADSTIVPSASPGRWAAAPARQPVPVAPTQAKSRNKGHALFSRSTDRNNF